MLHGLSPKVIENKRNVITETIYADEKMLITILDKKTGQRMQVETTFDEWCRGSLRVHDAMEILRKEFKNDGSKE